MSISDIDNLTDSLASLKMSDLKSDKDLETLIRKSSSERLTVELSRAQDVLDPDVVDSLSRTELVSYIFALRRLAGQHTAVKTLIKDFDVNKVIMLSGPEEVINPLGAEASPPTVSVPSTDVLILAFLQSMQDARVRQEKIEADREKKETEERVRQDKLASDTRVRLEKIEADREKALLEERARQDKLLVEKRARQDKILDDQKKLATEERIRQEKREQDAINFQLDKREEERQFREEQRATALREKTEAENRRIAENAKFDIRLEKAYRTLRGQLNKMPDDRQSVILYLKNLGDIFNVSQIDEDLRPTILAQNLNDTGRNAHAKFSLEIKSNYELLKQALLKNFRVTAKTCLSAFKSAIKTSSESYEQFCDRLRLLFTSYLHSRGVVTVTDLVELCLSDRFKDSLTVTQRGHVGDLEQDRWFTIEYMSKVMDHYAENHPVPYSSTFSSQHKFGGSFASRGAYSTPSHRYASAAGTSKPTGSVYRSDKGLAKPMIWNKCGGTNHDFATCLLSKGTPAANLNRSGSSTFRDKPLFPSIAKMQPKSQQPMIRKPYRTNIVTFDDPNIESSFMTSNDEYEEVIEEEGTEVEEEEAYYLNGNNTEGDSGSINRIRVASASVNNSTLNDHKISSSLSSLKKDEGLFVSVHTGDRVINALVDSGAQLSVIKPSMLPPIDLEEGFVPTQIILKGPFGEKEPAILTNIQAKLIESEDNPNLFPIQLTCAVTDKLEGDFMILCKSDYDSLVDHNAVLIPDVSISSYTKQLLHPYVTNNSDILENRLVAKVDAEEVNSGNIITQKELDIDFDLEKNSDLRDLQLSDPSLASFFHSSKEKHSKFFIESDSKLLYRKTQVQSLEINQLVLPSSKRPVILSTVHDALWANHLAVDKTLARIQHYFWWPGMREDVSLYIASCTICQRKQRLMKLTDCPLKPLIEPPLPSIT